MRCINLIKQPKHWFQSPIVICIVLLSLLSFLVTRLIFECGNETNISWTRRTSYTSNDVKVEDGDVIGERSVVESNQFGGNNHQFGGKQNVKSKPLDEIIRNRDKETWRNVARNPPARYEEIDCLINDEYTIAGRREGNTTFIPFSFLEKYFEVDGNLVQYRNDKQHEQQQRLEWHHSTARVYDQKPYKADGTFMTFEHYHVEQRSRVKHISGVEGVPISVQWDPKGYFYAIQIAQFGLSHYTKNRTDKEPVITTLEDADDVDAIQKWRQSAPSTDGKDIIRVVYDEERASNVVEFQTPPSSIESKGFVLQVNSEKDYVISFDALLYSVNYSICIVVETADTNKDIKLIYTNGEDTVTRQGNTITYGLGQITKWHTVTRNLLTDYRKGITQTNKTSLKKSISTLKKIKYMSVVGNGRIDNITLWTYNHMAHFMDAADWLMNNQDFQGGWPVMAERKLDDAMLPLQPGWYSAMAQGQAISTLTRAYKLTGDYRYLKSALEATKLYTIPSSKGGVLAKFLDIFPWYEEYPTTPSSFVLNGFMFSLIGLYDLKCIASTEEGRESARLFEEGMTSLKHMLHLYDTGTGSIYDLRHVTLQKEPNLARWGYHATHIAQLQLLTSIYDDPLLQTTLERWIGYTKGKKYKCQRNKRIPLNEPNKASQLAFSIQLIEEHINRV